MIPYLLLVLLLSLQTQACNEQSACLYFTTCYNESQFIPDTTIMVPTVNVTTNLGEAVEEKENCKGFAFVSTLSILSTSISTWNISFETDLNVVGFTLGMKGNSVQFNTTNNGMITIDGLEQAIDPSKDVSMELLGRTTYSFTVEDSKKMLGFQSLLGQPISLVLGEQIFDVDSSYFWKDFQAKMACDVTAIRDSCGNQTNCNQVLVSSHSLGCEHSSELWLSSSSGSWLSVSSTECRDQQWKFVMRNGTEEMKPEGEINVECRKPASNTTMDSDGSEVDDVSDSPVVPIAQKAEETTASPPAEEKKKEEEKSSLPWMWIGVAGALIIVIIILVIVLCLVCRKRNKNKAKKKQSKNAKRNKSNKGGKRADSSSAQPSSSESKLDPSAGTVQSSNPPPSSESVMQPATVKPGMTTEMNLDVLKTEMIN